MINGILRAALRTLTVVTCMVLGITLAFFSCSKELEVPLQGGLNSNVIVYNKEWIELQLHAAYGILDRNPNTTDPWRAAASNWIYGEVASDNAYKGSEEGDQPIIDNVERYQALASENQYYAYLWSTLYEGVARSNAVLSGIKQGITDKTISTSEAKTLEGEALFLRAHFHFEAKKIWDNIPYVTEESQPPVSNKDVDSWARIAQDFESAQQNLPATSRFVGAANRWMATSYLAKTYMYQLNYQAAKPLLDLVINSGPYSLAPKYSDNFNAAFDNNPESIFAVQTTVSDGASQDDNGNWGDALNFPNGAPIGGNSACCGFFQPSQNLVNAYKTDENGLPLLDTFNDSDVANDDGLTSTDDFSPHTGNLDPRLDWKIGRRGIDFNGWGIMPGKSWIRNQDFGGPYLQKITVFRKAQFGNESIDAPTAWAPGVSAMNTNLIRFAEILLWRAEAAAATNEGDLGLALVNRVRMRATNAEDFVKELDANGNYTTNPAANYKVGLYTAFGSQSQALKSIAHEYRIETALEGHRFFDLVRRGQAAEVLNTYLNSEQSKRKHLQGVSFTPKSVRYPIAQSIIAASKNAIIQNNGY